MDYTGKVLCDRYIITTEIGKGGMGIVYLAQDNRLNGFWAVKKVDTTQYEKMTSFLKEVELLTNLDYPTIPRIVDKVEVGNDYFVVMDLVNGIALNKKLEVEGPQKEETVIEWAKEICNTLQYLHTVHNNPIVYRDMKPHNLMLVSGTNQIKLIDFGIAKECVRGIPESELSVGTRGYAAPEQYKDGTHIYDERTDIYSVGCTLYSLLTGKVPGVPSNEIQSPREINPFLSEGIEHVILKCIEKSPENRYQNCLELKKDLDNIEMLNNDYKRKVQKRLVIFIISIILTILSGIMCVVGKIKTEKVKEQNFDSYYNQALSSQLQGDTSLAEEAYLSAIENSPGKREVYIRLLDMLSDESNVGTTMTDNTKYAVDLVRKYVENKNSEVYHDSQLMYEIASRCIDINDSVYAEIAVEYFAIIEKSDEYSNGTINQDDVSNLEILALSKARDFSNQDFEAFGQALLSLEDRTRSGELSVTERLNYYYKIILMYSNYPDRLDNSYVKMQQLGQEAKELIDNNIDEEMSFNKIIPLYEIVASNMYDYSVMQTEEEKKENALNEVILWFEYLDGLDYDLSDALALKKGNAFRNLYQFYQKQNDMASEKYINYLINAKEIYSNILKKSPTHFFAIISLAQVELEIQESKALENRDYLEALQYYQKAKEMKQDNKDLSSTALSRFSALKTQFESLGLLQEREEN